jgi:hypothetical protein
MDIFEADSRYEIQSMRYTNSYKLRIKILAFNALHSGLCIS